MKKRPGKRGSNSPMDSLRRWIDLRGAGQFYSRINSRFIGCMIPSGFSYFILEWMQVAPGWLGFIMQGAVLVILYIVFVVGLVMNRDERKVLLLRV